MINDTIWIGQFVVAIISFECLVYSILLSPFD